MDDERRDRRIGSRDVGVGVAGGFVGGPEREAEELEPLASPRVVRAPIVHRYLR